MKWNVKDVEVYTEAKEYVDTVLVPLIPIAFNDQMKQLSSASEFITILSMEIEKNFKGRILLTPTFYYLNGDANKMVALQKWVNELHTAKFTHIVFLTSDMGWKKDEKNVSGSLVWVPSISLELLEIEQAREIVKQQTKQIIDIFKDKWEINS